MTDRGSLQLDPTAFVDECPTRNCGVQWALPVDARLEALVRRAVLAGERTSRREMLSAIVCAFEADDSQLSQVLKDYRRKTVAEVVGTPDEGNLIRIPRFGPGPRRRGASPV